MVYEFLVVAQTAFSPSDPSLDVLHSLQLGLSILRLCPQSVLAVLENSASGMLMLNRTYVCVSGFTHNAITTAESLNRIKLFNFAQAVGTMALWVQPWFVFMNKSRRDCVTGRRNLVALCIRGSLSTATQIGIN